MVVKLSGRPQAADSIGLLPCDGEAQLQYRERFRYPMFETDHCRRA